MQFPKWPRRLSPAGSFLFCAQILALFLAPARTVRARQAPSPPPAIQSASDLVVVDVSILDKEGNFYSGLGESDFRILDNGVEKQPAFFTPVEAPAHVAILVETGPAVFLIHDQHLLALSALLNGLSPDDEAALFSYEQSAREVVPFTTDKAALGNSIGEDQFMMGMDQLNFFDSLRSVIDALPAGPEKKSIVVLTTGLDSSPPDRWDLLEKKLRAGNVVIFAVGLGGSLRGDAPSPAKKSKKRGPAPAASAASTGPSAFERADQALRILAQITGGQVYFPQAPDDFVRAYHEIAAALRNQYELGIAPDHDGTFHKISVEVRDSRARQSRKGKTPEYRALYREGYLAPAP